MGSRHRFQLLPYSIISHIILWITEFCRKRKSLVLKLCIKSAKIGWSGTSQQYTILIINSVVSILIYKTDVTGIVPYSGTIAEIGLIGFNLRGKYPVGLITIILIRRLSHTMYHLHFIVIIQYNLFFATQRFYFTSSMGYITTHNPLKITGTHQRSLYRKLDSLIFHFTDISIMSRRAINGRKRHGTNHIANLIIVIVERNIQTIT